jgi:hypothetical protein
VLAATVTFALLAAMPVVPAGAAEPEGSRRSTGKVGVEPSPERLKLRDQLDMADIERPEPGEVSALAADDDIPGVSIEGVSELPWPIVFEDLDAVTDPWDVYRVTAYPGDQINFYVDPDPLDTGSSTLDVGVMLWDVSGNDVAWPSTDEFLSDPPDGDPSYGPGVPVWLCYTVPAAAPSTTYYVGVHAFAGANEVDYQWGVTSRSDGNVPGVTIPPSGFSGHVDTDGDADDVYAIHLGEGEMLDVTLTVTDGDEVQLYLFGPGTADVWGGGGLPGSPYTADPTVDASYVVPSGGSGVYFLDIWAYGGRAAYTLDWEVTGVNVPGRPLPPSGTTLALIPGPNVGHVDLRPGETFTMAIDDSSDFTDVWLLGPVATDVSGARVANHTATATGKALTYAVPAGRGGRYYVVVDSGTDFSTDLTWSRKTNPARLAGAGRYDTAVLVSQRDFYDGADTVVIASGEGFADALSAAGLAGAYDAPVLLVPKTALPASVRAEIVRLGATRAILVGGTAVVTDTVKNAVDAIPGMAAPTRIAGPNRYETSALVADAVFTKCGWVDWYGMGALARGDNFADALALAPLSWAAKMPILLTATTYLPLPIDARLPGAGPTELPIFGVIFAGGTAAISTGVFSYVDAMVTNYPDPGDTIDCLRLAGVSRYETASKIAAYSASTGLLSYRSVGIATGANFPDALGGGAGIAKSGGVLLMTEPTRLTGFTASALSANKATPHEVQIFGGTGAVNASVFNAIKGMY